MCKSSLIITILILFSLNTYSQYRIDTRQARTDLYGVGLGAAQVINYKISCAQLLSTIKSYGKLEVILNANTLSSSWLFQVDAYTYDGIIYAVANLQNTIYIYCNISNEQWSAFVDDSFGTFGERFNQYISKNGCDCK